MFPKGSQKKMNTVIVMIDGKEPKTVTTMDSPPEPKKLHKCRLTLILPILLVVLLTLLAGYCAWLFFEYEAGPSKPTFYGNDAIMYNELQTTTEGAVDTNDHTPSIGVVKTNYQHPNGYDDFGVISVDNLDSESLSLTGDDFVFAKDSAESVYDSSARLSNSDDYEYSFPSTWTDDSSRQWPVEVDPLDSGSSISDPSSSWLGETTRKEDIDLWHPLSNFDKLLDYFRRNEGPFTDSYSFGDPSSTGKIYTNNNDDVVAADDRWMIDEFNPSSGNGDPEWFSSENGDPESLSSEIGDPEWFSSDLGNIDGSGDSEWYSNYDEGPLFEASIFSYPYHPEQFGSSSDDQSSGDWEFDSFSDEEPFLIEDWLASMDSYVSESMPPRPVIPPVPVDSVPPQRIEIAVCEWPAKEFERKATSQRSMKVAFYNSPEYRVTGISTDSASMTHILKDNNGVTTSTLIYRDYTSSIFVVKTVDARSSVCYFTTLTPDLRTRDHDNEDDIEEVEGSGSLLHTSGLRDMTLEIQSPILLGNTWKWPQLDGMLDSSCSTSTKYWANTIVIKE